jgi:hypothetical protein
VSRARRWLPPERRAVGARPAVVERRARSERAAARAVPHPRCDRCRATDLARVLREVHYIIITVSLHDHYSNITVTLQ